MTILTVHMVLGTAWLLCVHILASNESLAYVHFIKFMLQALVTVTLIVN